jgi:16S rRNA (cytosine967-C5)-methyltransferase
VNQQYTELYKQLNSTSKFIGEVLAGRSSDEALHPCPAPLRPATQALGFAVLRNLFRAEALIDIMARQKQPPDVRSLLLTSLALLSNTSSDKSFAYDDFTLVNQAVEAAKRQKSTQHASGFINACLRRFLREREPLIQLAIRNEQARWNHPAWWIKQVRQDHPTHWQSILEANLRRAPLILRSLASTSPTSPTLEGQALACRQVGAQAWALEQPLSPERIDGFSQGLWSVQDSAAQIAAPLLLNELRSRQSALQTPLRILDACAAPGGKTMHLLEWAGQNGLSVEVTALEIDNSRATRIDENLQRGGHKAKIIVADATEPTSWWDGKPFDGILLDAPCSASGIVRRHPDILQLRRASDIGQLERLQAKLLEALWPLLHPAGVMVYCTCSVFKIEGQSQVDAFLARNTAARLRPSPGHLHPEIGTSWKTIPDNQETGLPPGVSPDCPQVSDNDGFYYAVLDHA